MCAYKYYANYIYTVDKLKCGTLVLAFNNHYIDHACSIAMTMKAAHIYM